MSNFLAVMIDETGCEFSAEIKARNKNCAYDYLRENYPESRIYSVSTASENRARQRYIARRARRLYERDEYDQY